MELFFCLALFEHPFGFFVSRCLSHGGLLDFVLCVFQPNLWIALIALLGVVLLCCTTCLVSLVPCSTHIVWCVLSSVTFVPTVCISLDTSARLKQQWHPNPNKIAQARSRYRWCNTISEAFSQIKLLLHRILSS